MKVVYEYIQANPWQNWSKSRERIKLHVSGNDTPRYQIFIEYPGLYLRKSQLHAYEKRLAAIAELVKPRNKLIADRNSHAWHMQHNIRMEMRVTMPIL